MNATTAQESAVNLLKNGMTHEEAIGALVGMKCPKPMAEAAVETALLHYEVPAEESAETTGLVKYNAACHALAIASRIDEVKDIHDKAEAMRVYAKQAKNLDLERQAIEIRLRAERRTGELLIETKANGHRHDGRGNNSGAKKLESPDVTPTQKLASRADTPTLADLGISKRQASDWQKMALIPEPDFETKIKAVSETCGKVTTAAILHEKKGSEPEPQKIHAEETAQRLQDNCRKIGLNVDVAASKEQGKFHITYRNVSEAEIQQAISLTEAKGEKI